jgi:hypothetical protein
MSALSACGRIAVFVKQKIRMIVYKGYSNFSEFQNIEKVFRIFKKFFPCDVNIIT